MRANKLLQLLEYSNKEVYVKIDNDLFYPIRDVEVFAKHIIIYCKNVRASAESSSFEPLKFGDSVKTNKK